MFSVLMMILRDITISMLCNNYTFYKTVSLVWKSNFLYVVLLDANTMCDGFE